MKEIKTKKNKTRRINLGKSKTTTKNIRYESDVFGKIAVPKQHYWGATTARSLIHFSISTELMPTEFIHSYALFKKCAAKANYKLKLFEKVSIVSD